MIFAEPLKNKKAQTVKAAFMKIFKNNNIKPHTLSTDQGGEFQGLKSWFKEMKIYFIMRRGSLKASVAEEAIYRIKARLYRNISSGSDQSWPELLSVVVKNINNTPNSGIGFLTPNKIKDPQFDTLVLQKRPKNFYPMWQKQLKNIKFAKSKFEIGDEVYLTLPRPSFYKSYHLQRGQIYKISAVDKSISPVMYKLSDLHEKPVGNMTFYESELRRAPPNHLRLYPIEKILKTRKRKGIKEHLVKYMFYPNK